MEVNIVNIVYVLRRAFAQYTALAWSELGVLSQLSPESPTEK